MSSDTANHLKLLIVGDGPQKGELEHFVDELQLTDVTTFTGNVLNNSVCSYLHQMDIYVALSRLDSESFGVAILEASACELPVVVSNVGGLPEVVEDGKTGFVVPKENPTAAANALLELIENPSLRNQMGKEGRKMVIKDYEWSENVTRMENLYGKVLENFFTSKK